MRSQRVSASQVRCMRVGYEERFARGCPTRPLCRFATPHFPPETMLRNRLPALPPAAVCPEHGRRVARPRPALRPWPSQLSPFYSQLSPPAVRRPCIFRSSALPLPVSFRLPLSRPTASSMTSRRSEPTSCGFLQEETRALVLSDAPLWEPGPPGDPLGVAAPTPLSCEALQSGIGEAGSTLRLAGVPPVSGPVDAGRRAT